MPDEIFESLIFKVTDAQLQNLIQTEKNMSEEVHTEFRECLSDCGGNEDEVLDVMDDFSEKYGLGLQFIGVNMDDASNFVWDVVLSKGLSARNKAFTESWLKEVGEQAN